MFKLIVSLSNQHIYAQILDKSGSVLVSASTLEKQGNTENKKAINISKAKQVGSNVAKRAKIKNIDRIIFDRKNYKYHGRIKALVEQVISEGVVLGK